MRRSIVIGYLVDSQRSTLLFSKYIVIVIATRLPKFGEYYPQYSVQLLFQFKQPPIGVNYSSKLPWLS